jgi:hypothetical protein
MTAREALSQSYLTWDEIFELIKERIKHNETSLHYQMISPKDAEELKELGYLVFENVGDGDQTTIHWGEAIKRRYSNGKRTTPTITMPDEEPCKESRKSWINRHFNILR